MNINHEPIATRLMIDIKHQPESWLTFDIKRARPRPPVGRGNSGGAPGQRARSRAPRWAGEAPAAPERSVRPRPPVG